MLSRTLPRIGGRGQVRPRGMKSCRHLRSKTGGWLTGGAIVRSGRQSQLFPGVETRRVSVESCPRQAT